MRALVASSHRFNELKSVTVQSAVRPRREKRKHAQQTAAALQRKRGEEHDVLTTVRLNSPAAGANKAILPDKRETRPGPAAFLDSAYSVQRPASCFKRQFKTNAKSSQIACLSSAAD
jgi:hypothetical protein